MARDIFGRLRGVIFSSAAEVSCEFGIAVLEIERRHTDGAGARKASVACRAKLSCATSGNYCIYIKINDSLALPAKSKVGQDTRMGHFSFVFTILFVLLGPIKL